MTRDPFNGNISHLIGFLLLWSTSLLPKSLCRASVAQPDCVGVLTTFFSQRWFTFTLITERWCHFGSSKKKGLGNNHIDLAPKLKVTWRKRDKKWKLEHSYMRVIGTPRATNIAFEGIYLLVAHPRCFRACLCCFRVYRCCFRVCRCCSRVYRYCFRDFSWREGSKCRALGNSTFMVLANGPPP